MTEAAQADAQHAQAMALNAESKVNETLMHRLSESDNALQAMSQAMTAMSQSMNMRWSQGRHGHSSSWHEKKRLRAEAHQQRVEAFMRTYGIMFLF